jgi:hypothetical protein
MNRRTFLQTSAVAGLGLAALPVRPASFPDAYPPVEAITRGPGYHWFGYYDKWQVDPTGRYVLGCRVDFEGRSPTKHDTLRIGTIDLHDNFRWTEIGTSRAWGWQQGCMLQWIPGASGEAIWNDREGEAYVSRVVHVPTGKRRTLPKAIYALSSDGTFAVGTEFNRIQNLRPGYGYAGIPDPYANVKAPDGIGIYRLDLKSGKSRLIISIAEMATVPHQGQDVRDNWHWFNHLLIAPDSRRFLFLHRWREKITDRQEMAARGFTTRMITADLDGKDCYVLDPSGNSSHFVWRDPQTVFVWTQPVGKQAGFYLLRDKTQDLERVGAEAMPRNGHNTYVPHTNNEWVLNDTYPYHNLQRLQELYLYHVPTGRKVVLGNFHEPPEYVGEWRCDLHPRCNQQGTEVFFDSTHGGNGRQMYRISIRDIVRA